MIDGRILVSEYSVAAWLKEALERDQQRQQCSTMPSGWSLISARIENQCYIWHFNRADKQRLMDYMYPLYLESRNFLDLT